MAEVVSRMRRRAESKGFGLIVEFAGPIPESILTDPARLRQILLNHVGNAVKFTKLSSVRVIVPLANGERPCAESRISSRRYGHEAKTVARVTRNRDEPSLLTPAVVTRVSLTPALTGF